MNEPKTGWWCWNRNRLSPLMVISLFWTPCHQSRRLPQLVSRLHHFRPHGSKPQLGFWPQRNSNQSMLTLLVSMANIPGVPIIFLGQLNEPHLPGCCLRPGSWPYAPNNHRMLPEVVSMHTISGTSTNNIPHYVMNARLQRHHGSKPLMRSCPQCFPNHCMLPLMVSMFSSPSSKCMLTLGSMCDIPISHINKCFLSRKWPCICLR